MTGTALITCSPSASLTAGLRTRRCQRGAAFLTDPVDHGAETRCFFRDPDGHLFEISEYRRA